MKYTPAGLDRLLVAVAQQAEQDFLFALLLEFPTMPEHERTQILNRWRKLRAKAERRIEAEQGVCGHEDLSVL